MHWTRPLGLLVVIAIAAWAVGSLVSLATLPLAGKFATAAAAVLSLLVVVVLATAAVGAHGPRWLDNPGYW